MGSMFLGAADRTPVADLVKDGSSELDPELLSENSYGSRSEALDIAHYRTQAKVGYIRDLSGSEMWVQVFLEFNYVEVITNGYTY